MKLCRYLVIGILSTVIFKKLEHSSNSSVTSMALLFSFVISIQQDTALQATGLLQDIPSGRAGKYGLWAQSGSQIRDEFNRLFEIQLQS